MVLNIVVIVWGETYIDRFVHWALPSLLALGNLPALIGMEGLDCRFLIYAHLHEAKTIRESESYQRLVGLLPTQICPLPTWDYSGPACGAQNYVQRHVVDWIRSNQEAVLFCSPDVIWTDNSLGYVGQSLKAGRTAIFLPTYRVTDETVRYDEELAARKSYDLSLPSLLAGKLLLQHAHPLLGAFHYLSAYCPLHIEYVTWPVADEGLMMVHLVRGPDCFIPHLLDRTGQELISDNNEPQCIDPVQHSKDALGLSLTPISQCANWIIHSQPATSKKFGQFMARHHASLYGLLNPVMVVATEKPNLEFWAIEHGYATEFFDGVLKHRDAVLRGEMEHESYLNMPQSYGTKFSPDDCRLYQRLLKWAPPDCATVRLLERMAGDGW
jgi:hypothetical protein